MIGTEKAKSYLFLEPLGRPLPFFGVFSPEMPLKKIVFNNVSMIKAVNQ